MRSWWVNQNQTFRHEVSGGYLWSPKRKKNGDRNPFYEFMREVAPGDLIFSFADTRIKALGIALSHAFDALKPQEFGSVGSSWELSGWRVNVSFTALSHQIQPSQHLSTLAKHLGVRYAPLTIAGAGLQSVYLTRLSGAFATDLLALIGEEAQEVLAQSQDLTDRDDSFRPGQVELEEHLVQEISAAPNLTSTDKLSLIVARKGQGLFRARVASFEKCCRLTGASRIEYLRASHIKPWRASSNVERLDGENGLMLTPDADFLFDRGLITFDDSGKVLVSPVADVKAIECMGLSEVMLAQSVGGFTSGQRRYLAFHRENVFLKAQVS